MVIIKVKSTNDFGGLSFWNPVRMRRLPEPPKSQETWPWKAGRSTSVDSKLDMPHLRARVAADYTADYLPAIKRLRAKRA